MGGGRGRGTASAGDVRAANEGARAPLGNRARRRAGPARAPARTLAASGRAASAPGRAEGSARTVERLRRGEVAAPAGRPRGPSRSVVPGDRAARRRLRHRRPCRTVAGRGHDAGSGGRSARRDRSDRPRPHIRRRPEPARRLPGHGPLSLSRRRWAEGRRCRRRRRDRRPAPRSWGLRGPAHCTGHGGGVRTCRRAPSVRGASGTRRGTRIARLAGRPRARPVAGTARRRGCPPGLEPVCALRRRLSALVCRRRLDLRRDASRRPGTRGIPGVSRARAAHRRVHGVRSRDCTRDVVPVPPGLARHRPGKRRRGSGRRRGARPRAPDRSRCARRTVGRLGDGRAQWVGRLARGGLCACLREHPRRPDHLLTRGRRSRPGSGRPRRLCLAAWRASAS